MADSLSKVLNDKYPGVNAEEVQQFMHNWLYSVVPVSERVTDYIGTDIIHQEISYPLGAYLTGYCRVCRKAFSQPIPAHASGYLETQMDIPVWGCVAPQF